MARYVFVADRRPDWARAQQLIDSLGERALIVAGEAYGTNDPAEVHTALTGGLARLHSEWDANFFLEGGVVAADTHELVQLATALSDLGIAEAVGLTVNATVR